MRPTFCVTPKSIFLLMVIAICIDCAILLWRSENSSSQALSSSDTDAHFKIRAHPKKIHTYMNNKEGILNEKAMEFCKETKLTLCKPTPRRSDSDRAADSHRRSPFKIASLRKDPFLSVVTSFRDWQYDNCKFCETARKDIGDVDGVYVYVLSMRDEKVPVPRDRRSDQSYFMVTWEAPIHTAADSLKSRIARETKKTALCVDTLGQCCGGSKSSDYVREMQKYTDVGIFQNCGHKCHFAYEKKRSEKLTKTYTFFLSFKKSLCTDFITDTFFRLYQDDSYIAPVVGGGEAFITLFPHMALLNAENYAGPKELAVLLKALAANEDTCSSLLEVKDRNRGIQDQNKLCQVCELLRKNEGRMRTKKWHGDGHCWVPGDI